MKVELANWGEGRGGPPALFHWMGGSVIFHPSGQVRVLYGPSKIAVLSVMPPGLRVHSVAQWQLTFCRHPHGLDWNSRYARSLR